LQPLAKCFIKGPNIATSEILIVGPISF